MTLLPFNDMGLFFRKRFPRFKVQKISVDAGFSCPNRDGSKGLGGCIYCNNAAFTPSYCGNGAGVSEQIARGREFFARKYPDMRYLVYFQSYTGTYAAVERVKSLYDEALSCDGVEGLIIATRPDCMPDELLDYLHGVSQRRFVLVEYGAESCNDDTLVRINRCHTWNDTVDAVARTAERGILCGLHLILGLPGEGREAILQSADVVSQLPVTTLKLHQLQVIRGTALARMFGEDGNAVHVYGLQEYVGLVADFIERVRPDIVMDRFVSQSPSELLVAPRWGVKNHEFTALLTAEMKRRSTCQGAKYSGEQSPSVSL